MENLDVLNIIPRNKRGEPKTDRLKDIAAMLLHYRYSDADLQFFVKEIELLSKPKIQDFKDEEDMLT